MQRSPLGGRGFESFSEDPVVSGLSASLSLPLFSDISSFSLAVSSAYVNGVQSKKVAACIKHFVANDQVRPFVHSFRASLTDMGAQEFERFSMDSVVSQRALRELYLEPFRIAMKHSSPQSFMTSYNKVNGIHASESRELLEDILRKEWGGNDVLTMSDWTGSSLVSICPEPWLMSCLQECTRLTRASKPAWMWRCRYVVRPSSSRAEADLGVLPRDLPPCEETASLVSSAPESSSSKTLTLVSAT